MSLMRKGAFAVLATYVAIEMLARMSCVIGFVAGVGVGSVVTYLVLR